MINVLGLAGASRAGDTPPSLATCPDSLLLNDTTYLREPIPRGGPPIVADLDGDGRPEIVIAVPSPGRLMLFTHAPGRIGVPRFIELEPVGEFGPSRVTAFDLDDDGDQDLVLASQDGSMWLLRNDGGLRFTTTDTFLPMFGDIVRADRITFERSGSTGVRLFYPSQNDASRSIPVTADLTFGDPMVVEPARVRSLWFVALDDDEPDDLVGITNGFVKWSSRIDEDTWSEPTTLSLGATVADADLADVDGDGRCDIVITAASGASRFLVLLGDAEVGFLPPIATGGPRETFDTAWTTLADVDGDGRAEVFTIRDPVSDEIVAFRSTGGGQLEESTRRSLLHLGGPAVAADADGDGHQELVIHGRWQLSIGTLTSIDIEPTPSGAIGVIDSLAGAAEARMLDVVGPSGGPPELISVRGGDLVVASMQPDGELERLQTLPIHTDALGVTDMHVRPRNPEGVADVAILVTEPEPAVVSVTWTAGRPETPFIAAVDPNEELVRIGTLERNAPPSLVLVRNDTRMTRIVRRESGGLRILDEFAHPGTFGDVLVVEVVDMDGDGVDDVILALTQTNGPPLVIRHGNGDGTVGEAMPIRDRAGTPVGSVFLVALDLDDDGSTDLVTGGVGPDRLGLVRHLGERQYGVTEIPLQGIGPGLIAFAAGGDLDGDGEHDFIASALINAFRSIGTDRAPLLRRIPQVDPSGFTLAHPSIGDLDGDGLGEVLLNRLNGDGVTLIRGSVCARSCDPDLNADGTVDYQDLLLILVRTRDPVEFWPLPEPGDLDRDGDVDADDLGVLIAAWGPCPGG